MSQRRFLLVDQSIRDGTGHFLELASVILSAAEKQGFEPWLVTNETFLGGGSVKSSWTVRPVLTHHKMQRWSMTPYGHSRVARDRNGRPAGNGLLSALQFFKDRLHRVRPEVMLDQFATELATVLTEFCPTQNDQILFATCDDFCALAVAEAFRRADLRQSVDLHILSHANFLEQRECEWAGKVWKSPNFSRQIALTLTNLQPHRVHFWATTNELARQLNWIAGAQLWSPVCYPVRNSLCPKIRDTKSPRRIFLGGAVRSEKGLSQISQIVDQLWTSHLQTGRWQIAMQVPKNLQSYVLPKSLRSRLPEWREQGDQAPVILASGHLDPESYAEMIRTADAGLFLYDGRRYYTRCSGVLVEMLSCGVPVIVPAASWLSRQLAPAYNAYIDSVACQFSRSLSIHDPHVMLPIRASAAHSITTPGSTTGMMRVAVTLADPTEYDYLAVQIDSLRSNRQTIRSELRILECCTAGPTQLLIKPQFGASAFQIRLWSPYPQRPLALRRIELLESDVSGVAIPVSTVGLIHTGNNCILQNIDELEDHYAHYRGRAIQHADDWRQRYSGDGFLKTLSMARED